MTSEPTFVLSCRRSGSTLLRVMLAGHPGLFSPPELNLGIFSTFREREKALGPCTSALCRKHACDQREGLQRAFMELKSVDAAASKQIIDDMLERNVPVVEVYDSLIRMASPRRLVDKSPLYSMKYENLQKLACLFPRARYIFLHRHPCAVIDSLLRNEFEPSHTKAEAAWREANGNIQKFLTAVDPKQQFMVSFEDLVSAPEAVMQRICAFLGISLHPSMLTPYEGNRMTDGVRPGVNPPGDGNFLGHKMIDQSLGSIWREIVFQRPMEEETGRMSAALGYDLGIVSSV